MQLLKRLYAVFALRSAENKSPFNICRARHIDTSLDLRRRLDLHMGNGLLRARSLPQVHDILRRDQYDIFVLFAPYRLCIVNSDRHI